MAGKSLNDLNLSDQPLPDPDPDPRGTAWYRFVQDIEDLLASGSFNWAETTLRDIQVTVEQTKRVTEGQRRAVNNIEAARQRTPRGGSRRYEGFR